MLHPDTKLEFIDNDIGHGAVAARSIPAGTITWALDDLDMEFIADDVGQMPLQRKEYMRAHRYRNNKGNHVLCSDRPRSVNHSSDSNCLSATYGFEVAVRDIRPGEQFTDDYGYLNVESPFEPVDKGFEIKMVRPDGPLHFHELWDERLNKIFSQKMEPPQAMRIFR